MSAGGGPPDEAQVDRDFVVRAVRLLLTAVLVVAVLVVLLRVLRAALTPLAASFVLAYLLDPVIDRFESRGLRRGVSIVGLLVVFGAGAAALLFFVLPRLITEVSSLAAALPGYLETFSQTWIPRFETRFGVTLPASFTEVVDKVRSGEIPLPLDSLASVLRNTLTYLTGTMASLVGLLMVPILTFYALVDFDHIVARAAGLVPPRYRPYVHDKAVLINGLVSSFLRGQLIISLILGVLYAVGFSVIGIDLAVSIGLIAGALSIIPYVGSAFALVSGLALALLKFGPDSHMLWIAGWYAVVQTLEGLVITPRVQGESIGLHPAVIIVALLIGGDLFGLLGLLIAVPVAAVAKVLAAELLDVYRASSLFGEEAAADGDPPG